MSNALSSPEPLGLICHEPVALDATQNMNFFIWLTGIESAEQIKNIIYRALTFYFLPLELQTRNPCLVYVDRDNSLLLAFILNAMQ